MVSSLLIRTAATASVVLLPSQMLMMRAHISTVGIIPSTTTTTLKWESNTNKGNNKNTIRRIRVTLKNHDVYPAKAVDIITIVIHVRKRSVTT